jgi:oxygen-independent coproporphyrinogen-3 oxidase
VLRRDLLDAEPAIAGRRIGSIFIGGGTPSLLTAGGLERLLTDVRATVALLDDVEITLEANPGAIDSERFAAFRAAGVTRLSLGVQSFDDAKLAALGRIHGAADARRAVELAQRNFPRVNLDLMYALPGQTLADAQRDLATAIASGVGHISAYHLTVEANTAFHRAPPALPDDDLAADMQETVESTLAAAGYGHYETSAFARAEQCCRHNLNYWTFGDYLGIGAGAHGKLTGPSGGVVRETRPRHPNDYLTEPRAAPARQRVDTADLPGEFMMNALRLIDGFPTDLFTQRTGLPLAIIDDSVERAIADGLLNRIGSQLVPTLLGQRHLNALIGRFL